MNNTNSIQFTLFEAIYSTPDMVKVGILADKYNFDCVMMGDHALDFTGLVKADPWGVLSNIGAKTNNIKMGTDVTCLYRYHPSKIAHIVATLDELTRGRIILGLGAGEAMNVEPFGIKFEKPIQRIRRLKEGIEVIRALWNSNENNRVDYDGEFYKMNKAWLQQEPYKNIPPIYIGSLGGEKMLNLIGEIGDGWQSACNSIEMFRDRVKIIKESAIRNKRDYNKIDKCATIVGVMTEDKKIQKQAIEGYKHVILILNNIKSLIKLGLELDNPDNIDLSYQTILAKQDAVKESAKIAQQIPDEFTEQFMVLGTSEEFIEKIDQYKKAGATNIFLWDWVAEGLNRSPKMAEENLRIFNNKVMKYFKE